MKNLFLLLVIIISYRISSQEVLFEKEIKLSSTFLTNETNKSFPFVNKVTSEISLFLIDRKEIKSYLFDTSFTLIDSFSTKKPKKKYTILLGTTFEKNNYHLLFTNENKDKFLRKSINIESKKSLETELEIKFKKEYFLESISYKNKIYIITIKRGKSILNIYKIEGSNYSKVTEIDLSKHKFTKNLKSLNYILSHTTAAIKDKVYLNKIDNTNPNALGLVSSSNKVYCYDDTLYLTIDVYNTITKIISINLANFDFKVKDYYIPNIDCENNLGLKSNSFLLENNLFQVSGCENELYFSISNLKTGNKTKEWSVTLDEDISFKNTPFIQLGGVFSKNEKYKELDGTKKFLKKINQSRIGISAYKRNGNTEITIGGFKKIYTKEIIANLMLAGAVLSGGSPDQTTYYNYCYNPSMYSFNHYYYHPTMYHSLINSSKLFSTNNQQSISIYFKSLFNQNLKNIKGELKENAFDKIKIYLSENKKITTLTVFKYKESYILGYYNTKEKKYYLLKFFD